MRKAFVSLAFLLVAACYSSTGQVPVPASSPPPAAAPAPVPEPAPQAGGCVPSGCSGTLCVAEGKEVMSTCEYKNEYACYAKAKCEKQASGECGWSKSAELDACIAAGGPK
jgi:hypothetical protein